MKRKTIRRIACLWISGLLLTGTAGALSINDGAGNLDADSLLELHLDSASGYTAYLAAHPGETREERIVLEAAGARPSETAVTRVGSAQGKDAVLLWEKSGGSVELTFTVAQTGLYPLEFRYLPLGESEKNVELAMEIDGEIPYAELSSFVLKRQWIDDEDAAFTDIHGNQFTPKQKEKREWTSSTVISKDGLITDPLAVFLEAGAHTMRLYSLGEPFALTAVVLGGGERVPDYAEYARKHGDVPRQDGSPIRVEAEAADTKSDKALVPSIDKSDPLTYPPAGKTQQLNVMGLNWNDSGQWVEWKVEVKQTGMYRLFFRYRQDGLRDMSVCRRLTVDGVVPFREAEAIAFPYGSGWDGLYLTAGGEAAYLYLEEGIRTLRLTVVQGEMGPAVQQLDDTLLELNGIYRKITMITGANPDPYRDYNLETEIPELLEVLGSCRDALEQQYQRIREIQQTNIAEAGIIQILISQLDSMREKPNTIPQRIREFNTNIGSLAAWVLDMRGQPLSLDYLCLLPEGSEPEPYRANLFQSLAHELKLFFYSFTSDYASVGQLSPDDADMPKITMWLGTGRDQAQIIRRMINESFTPETGIQVDLKLVSASMVEAFLTNDSPDVAIMMGRSQPVNLAARGALYDLSQFEDFEQIMGRFARDAAVPFTFEGGVYGIPDTTTFFMTFYRKDILRELGYDYPKTWEEFYHLTTVIQRRKMEVGLPYTAIDAWGAVEQGMGARNIFPALLLQKGGKVYSDDLSATLLDTDAAKEAFNEWVEFYTQRGFEVTYDLYNRFRTGQMPLAIAPYTTYNQLEAAAPEISGLWGIAPIPGTVKEDGALDIRQASASTAAVILSKTKAPDASWRFLKWWTQAETQWEYSNEMEAAVGALGRVAVSNLEALRMLPWDDQTYTQLKAQMDALEEIPEIVGSYYTVRCLDNAFRSCVYENKPTNSMLEMWNEQINTEIAKKRKELQIGAT